MKKEIELDISEFIGLELMEVHPHQMVFSQAILELWCPWRIYDEMIFMNQRVLNDQQHTAEAETIVKDDLIGRKIRSIQIFENPCDIRIEFEEGIILEVFPDHPIYESWNLKFQGTNGRHLIGIPGGQVTWFLKDGEKQAKKYN